MYTTTPYTRRKWRRTGGLRYRTKKGYTPKGVLRKVGYYGRFGTGKNAELKFFDSVFDVTSILSTGNIRPSINLIPQGTTESERIGRRATIKAIQWKIDFVRTAETDDARTGALVRMILYIDGQANGVAASVTDILEVGTILSHYNLVNQGRFKILTDRTLQMNSKVFTGDGINFSSGVDDKYVTFNKICNIGIEFSGVTGVITEVRSNNVGVLLISSGTAKVGINSCFRVRFHDG